MLIRAGSIFKTIPLLAAMAFLSGEALAQSPGPPSPEQVLSRARLHAGRRMLDAVRRRLNRLWPREAGVAGAFLKSSGLESDLVRWIGQKQKSWESIQRFPDGTLEVRLTVPLAGVSRFLKQAARKRALFLEPWKENLFDAMAPRGEPFESVAGVGIPKAQVLGAVNVPMAEVWERHGKRVQIEVRRAANNDAVVNLWKKIELLQVAEGMFIRSFLDADPARRRDLAGILDPMVDRTFYPPRYLPTGRCEVDVFLDLVDLEGGLEGVAKMHTPDASPWRNVDFERLQWANGGRRMIWATGTGFLPGLKEKVPDWAAQRLSAEGAADLPVNAPSQEAAAGMASQKAQENARLNLWKKVLDLKLPSGKTLGELTRGSRKKEALWRLIKRTPAGGGLLRKDRRYIRPIQIPLEKVWKLVKDWK